MGRSKEMSKPVEDLTLSELKTEQLRCQTLLQSYMHSEAKKNLSKRLREITKRLVEN